MRARRRHANAGLGVIMRVPTARLIGVIAVITTVGAFLRLSGLSDRDFWFDESCTFIYVDQLFDWPEDSDLLSESTNLPYYFLLRGWVAVFGGAEAAYRSMSAVAALLTIPILAFVGYRLRGSIGAIVCAALVAVHPLHIHYAHEARAYALWTLLLAFTLLLLVEACRRGRTWWWMFFGLSLVACLHLHYFTIYWVPASVAVVLFSPDRRGALRRWTVTVALTGLAFLPYMVLAILPAARGGGGAWLAPDWDPIMAIPNSLWAMLPSGGYPTHLRGLSMLSRDTMLHQPLWLIQIAWTVPAVIVAIMLIVLALRPRINRNTQSESRGAVMEHVAFVALTLVPLLLAWAYSVMIRPTYLAGRYDLVVWPGLMVWLAVIIVDAASTISSRWRSSIAGAVCVVLAACSLIPVARMAALKPQPSFHHVRAERLTERSNAGDLALAFSYDRDYLTYYLHRADFPGRIVSYPSWLDRQIGWVDTPADSREQMIPALRRDANERVKLIGDVLDRGDRVWMLWDSMDRQGSSPRSAIYGHFARSADTAGLRIESVDSLVGIYEIKRKQHAPQAHRLRS